MRLSLVKSLWGVPAAMDTSSWDRLFERIAGEGFEAVETIPLVYGQNGSLLKTLLQKHGLKLIVQIHTSGGLLKDGDYVYCSSCSVDDHITSFRRQVSEALTLKPAIINCHSGHDSWSLEMASSYLRQTLDFERNCEFLGSTVIVHETHRQRLFFNPFQTAGLLDILDLQDIKLNADLSHWVCTCERVFDDIDRDPWWPGLLEKLANRCYLIHARFGHPEGPQVFDPRRSDLFGTELTAHLTWWKTIWRIQRERGLAIAYVEPEHGPHPYQMYFSIPSAASCELSEVEKADILWDINFHVAKLVKEHYYAL